MMTQGKGIWGSTRYFIKIDLNSNIFSTTTSGIVAFYDTKGLIQEKECNNLKEIVQTVFDFWSTILAPHETRVARWVEEYFNEMGVASDYNLIMRLLKSDELFEPEFEKIVEEKKSIDNTLFEQAYEIAEDNIITGHTSSLIELPKDEFQRDEFVRKLIEENKVEVPEEIKSRTSFTLPNGETKELLKKDSIDVGNEIGNYNILSGFENDYEETVSDVQIINEIPYSFKIEKIDIEGANIEPLKKKQDHALEVIWEIPEVEPKKKIEISYNMRRRINRTIVEIADDKVNVLNSYEEIKEEGLKYLADTKYINLTNKPLSLYITDEIPPEFSLIRTNPDTIPPEGLVEEVRKKGVKVKWVHKKIDKQDVLEKSYILDYYPYLFRGKKVYIDGNGNEVAKAVKIIYPIQGQESYKLIYVIKNINIEQKKNVSILDAIPNQHLIMTKIPEDTQIVEETDGEKKKLSWVTDLPKKNNLTKVEIKITGTKEPLFELFKIQIGEKKEGEILDSDSIIKRDMVSLP